MSYSSQRDFFVRSFYCDNRDKLVKRSYTLCEIVEQSHVSDSQPFMKITKKTVQFISVDRFILIVNKTITFN